MKNITKLSDKSKDAEIHEVMMAEKKAMRQNLLLFASFVSFVGMLVFIVLFVTFVMLSEFNKFYFGG